MRLRGLDLLVLYALGLQHLSLAFASRFGHCLSNSSVMPPELSAHGQPGQRAGLGIRDHTFGRLHLWNHFLQQRVAKSVEIAIADCGMAKAGKLGDRNLGRTVAEAHHNQHRPGLPLSDQVAHDNVRAADGLGLLLR